MNTNKIPQTFTQVLNLALRARSGAQAHGATIELKHNPSTLIDADYFDLTGNPATPEIPGKQALLNAQLLLIKTTGAAVKAALKNARIFCQTGFGVLKPLIEHRWNGDWNVAGFTSGNLTVPRLPLSTLVQFRAYLEANPAHEWESAGFTAAAAQAHVTAIQNAIQAWNTARGRRWSVKAARDAAFQRLRKRLSNLRAELALLIPPTDDRWYAFGFRRPADGSMPAPVSDLVLTPGGPGIVLAHWEPSSLAENYRVSWRLSSSLAEPTQIGLFTEPQCALTGLPSGQNIAVLVTARNDSGETEATEEAIGVP